MNVLSEETKHRVANEIRSYTEEDIERDFANLRELAPRAQTVSASVRTGNKTVDYFTFFERLNTVGKEGISFFEFYADRRKYMNRPSVQRLRAMEDKKNDSENWYEIFRLYFGSINIFRPLTAMEFYARYKPRCVLDPTMGWGGRLIGACAMDVPKYIGIDLNKQLRQPYRLMTRFLQQHSSTDIELHFQNALTFDYRRITYDMVLTSPPYYNIEIYRGVKVYPDKDKWDEKFYRPLFAALFAGLQKRGHLCLNVPPELYERVLLPMFGRPTHRHPLRRARSRSAEYDEFIYVWQK